MTVFRFPLTEPETKPESPRLIRRPARHSGTGIQQIKLHRDPIFPQFSKSKDIRGTIVDAGATTNTLGICHGEPLTSKGHDVDALMTLGGANVARDTAGFVGEDPKAGKSGIDIHEGGKRTNEAAPGSARKMPIKTNSQNPRKKQIHKPLVVDQRNTLLNSKGQSLSPLTEGRFRKSP